MLILNLFTTFFQIGLFSFGGGYAMLPVISRAIVDQWHWLTPSQFADVVAVSGVTPGPIAINAATFVGKKVAGVWGSAAATLGVVMPSFIIMLTFAYLLKRYGKLTAVQSAFKGIRPVVAALITSAALFMVKESVTDWFQVALAVGALVVARKTKIHPIPVLIVAGVLGVVRYTMF